MTICDNISAVWIIFLMCISLGAFLFGLYYFLFHNRIPQLSKRSFENRIIVSSFMLLIAIWCMRFMVGFSGVLYKDCIRLSFFEEAFNSVVHSLQSFSLDECFTEYLEGGKLVMAATFKDSSFMVWFYAIYVSLLNVISPVMGGAILYAILTVIFPRIKLWFISAKLWNPVYYFSELNDYSLALATSLRSKEKSFHKSIIVFFDVYTDSDDEDVSERIQKAKYLNAICLKDDICDMYYGKNRKKTFFLMDEKENGSLQALAAFRNPKMYRRLNPKDEIYIFGSDDNNHMAVNAIHRLLEKEFGEGKSPFIMNVNGIRNVIYRLLQDKPLFSAKQGTERKEDEALSVVIFGSGSIGTEMFLATYWCGQMLDYTLNITVVSKEERGKFEARINHINSDIFETANPHARLLKIYKGKNEEFAPVYFNFDYMQTDILHDDLYTKLVSRRENGRMADADYFVVALGTDEENQEVADKLGRFVTIARLSAAKRNENPEGKQVQQIPKKSPISYVVYDDSLIKLLRDTPNEESLYVDMYPFGSISETYSCGKILFNDQKENYNRLVYSADPYEKTIGYMLTNERKFKQYYKNLYGYWANVARAIHIQYKAFCAENIHSIAEYKKAAEDENSALNQDERMAWLEHRRWSAFMRASGFKRPSITVERGYIALLPDIDNPEDETNKGKHKNLELKLHPCLVECAQEAVPGKKDMLDIVTERFKNNYLPKMLKTGNYKQYDKPRYDFEESHTEA